jgi:hypothetical protein
MYVAELGWCGALLSHALIPCNSPIGFHHSPVKVFMSVRLISHPCGNAYTLSPSNEYLKKYILTHEDPSVCWLWQDDEKTRIFSKENQAIIVYRANLILPLRKWSVVRLLKKNVYENARGSFVCTCDNSKCVNPDHWIRPKKRKIVNKKIGVIPDSERHVHEGDLVKDCEDGFIHKTVSGESERTPRNYALLRCL